MRIFVIWTITIGLLTSSVWAVSCAEVQDDELPSLYVKLVCNGNKLLEKKAYGRALKLFEKALTLDLEDRANYALYENVIEASCHIKPLKEVRFFIKEYACMLHVDEGGMQCQKEYGFKLGKNSEISDLCYSTMCQTAYIDDYKNPTKIEKVIVKERRKKLAEIKSRCKKGE